MTMSAVGNVTKIDLSTYEFAPPLRATVTTVGDDYLITLTFSPDESHACCVAFRVHQDLMPQFIQDIERARQLSPAVLAGLTK